MHGEAVAPALFMAKDEQTRVRVYLRLRCEIGSGNEPRQ